MVSTAFKDRDNDLWIFVVLSILLDILLLLGFYLLLKLYDKFFWTTLLHHVLAHMVNVKSIAMFIIGGIILNSLPIEFIEVALNRWVNNSPFLSKHVLEIFFQLCWHFNIPSNFSPILGLCCHFCSVKELGTFYYNGDIYPTFTLFLS